MSVLLCYPDRGRGQGVAHVGPDLSLRDVAGCLGAVRGHPYPAAWLSPERLRVSKHTVMFGFLFLHFWGKYLMFCPHFWKKLLSETLMSFQASPLLLDEFGS